MSQSKMIGEVALEERDAARYQIRRAIAQLEIVEAAPLDVYRIRDTASAVLAQLRAYLEEQKQEPAPDSYWDKDRDLTVEELRWGG